MAVYEPLPTDAHNALAIALAYTRGSLKHARTLQAATLAAMVATHLADVLRAHGYNPEQEIQRARDVAGEPLMRA